MNFTEFWNIHFLRLINVFFLFVTLFQDTTAQNLPDYWHGKITTTKNGTMEDAVPFKIFGNSIEFNKQNTSRNNQTLNWVTGASVNLPANMINPSNEPPENKTGTMHQVTLTKGMITEMRVLDQYNFDGSGRTPVKICTSWILVDEANSLSHSPFFLEESVKTQNLLNITMHSEWYQLTDNEKNKIDEGRYWELDQHLCYYRGSSAKIVNGKCILPYEEVIQYFIDLWQLDFVNLRGNAILEKVSNNLDYLLNEPYPCAVIPEYGVTCQNNTFEKITYISPEDTWIPPIFNWYRFSTSPAAIGYAENVTFGYNKTKKVYDLNFTILFDTWTSDFPDGILSAFRDYAFKYDKFNLEMWYWVEDPPIKPERDFTHLLITMIAALSFPVFVISLAMFLRTITRSKKSFRLDVWKFSIRQKEKGLNKEKLKKLKKDKLHEMVDVRKQKEYEKILQEQNSKDLENQGDIESIMKPE